MHMDLTVKRAPVQLLLLVGAIFLLVGHPAAADETSDYLGRRMPYVKFDALPTSTIEIDDAKLVVGFAPSKLGQARATVLSWVNDSARAITTYFGRFPVERLRILIVPV